jgi:CRISPR-associated endonuclease/helicase Cas3
LLRDSDGELDINDPVVFRRYYQALYGVSRPVEQNLDLTAAINGLDFPEIAKRYKLIDQDAIQVVVPWQPRIEQYKRLREQAAIGIDGKWMREAQTLAVSIYTSSPGLGLFDCRTLPAWWRIRGMVCT